MARLASRLSRLFGDGRVFFGNSGAEAVVEGCGANGCEYMTNGTCVVLGPVGDNFGAGMTGGMAFVYDTDGSFAENVNADTVVYHRIQSPHWQKLLRDLVVEHYRETQSRYAERLLVDWDRELRRFWHVVPKEMLDKLEHPVLVEPEGEAAARA